MILIVDANVLFSALIKRSFTFDLFESLSGGGFDLHSPQYLLEEIETKRNRLLEYSKLMPSELDFVAELLLGKIKIISKSEYESFLSEAKDLAPHIKDAAYFALALSLNCAIWSDEKAFKKQDKVKVYSTSELFKELGLRQ